MPSAARTPQRIISESLGRNRVSESLLYLFASVSLLAGVGTLVAGVYRRDNVAQVAGVLAGSFFYPAMRLAARIRNQNQAIMLLEIPLNQAATAEEAAKVLAEFFRATIPKP